MPLSWLLLSAWFAPAGMLAITTDRPALVWVDGIPQPATIGASRFNVEVIPGLHEVEVRSANGAHAWKGWLDIGDGQLVRCSYSRADIACTRPPQVVTTAPPPPPPPSEVTLIVRSLDGEWADVFVDGKLVFEMRNEQEAVTTVAPGWHTVEVQEFMDDMPYATGRVDTGMASTLTLGIREDMPITCYDHPGWRPGR